MTVKFNIFEKMYDIPYKYMNGRPMVKFAKGWEQGCITPQNMIFLPHTLFPKVLIR